MRSRLGALLRPAALRPPHAELVLAVVVTAVMAADLGQSASVGLGLLAVVPAGLTLAWRLRLPELPLVLICAANLGLMATAPGKYGPQTVVIGVLIAVYTAAAHLSGTRMWLAGGASLAMVWAAHLVTPDGRLDDFLPFVVWGLPWLAGRLVRRQTMHARAAGARAAIAELEARDAVRVERDRIARELHDVVAHGVSLMVVQAGAARMELNGQAPKTVVALEAIESAGRNALHELRAMLSVLRTPELTDERSPQPDLAALTALVNDVRAAGLPVELTMHGDRDVPPDVGRAAYRIVQEALTNSLRHAGAVPTTVTVTVESDLLLEVRNSLTANGSRRHVGSGRGLVGMRERAILQGGSLSAAEIDGVWVVRAQLPLTRPVLS